MARQQSKDLHQKHQAILSRLLKDDDNKYCVDCDAKGPRWASWNLGIFLCIRCAGIHRNLGVHISKVKSINLDSWTAEQIASVEDMGNSRARAVYEANLPDQYKRPASSDSSMEQFIRAKYEHKKYIAREWVPPKPRSIPANYYDTEPEPKRETKKQVKTVLTIPGAAAGTAAAKSAKVERVPPVKKEEAPSLMVDVSAPPKQVNGSAQPQTTSTDLLADIFSSPSVPAQPASGSADLFGMSTSQPPPGAVQSSGDDDLFKAADEKSQTAKDSIMALFGNAPNPQQNMMNMNAQQQMMYSNGAMMGGSYPQTQQAPGAGMIGGYSMAGQQPNMMMSSQQGFYQQPQGMMGNMQQQGMMGNMQQQGMMGNMQQQGMMGNMQQQGMMSNMQQQGMMGNMHQQMYPGFQHGQQQQQQQMFAAQQLQTKMANLSVQQQQMSGMAQQSAAVTPGGGAWAGSAAGQNNGQTLNFDLWN